MVEFIFCVPSGVRHFIFSPIPSLPLQAQYDVDRYLRSDLYDSNREYLELVHFVMAPQFTPLHAHFLREVMRLSGASVVFFRAYPPYDEHRRLQTTTALQDAFRPVRQRRQIVYPAPSPPRPFWGCEDPSTTTTAAAEDGRSHRGGGGEEGGRIGVGKDEEACSHGRDRDFSGDGGGGGGSVSVVAMKTENLPREVIAPSSKKHQQPAFALNVLPKRLIFEPRLTQVRGFF